MAWSASHRHCASRVRVELRGVLQAMNSAKKPAVRLFATSFAMTLLLVAIVGCGEESAPQYETKGSVGTGNVSESGYALSGKAIAGEELFNANCSVCHGMNAVGTNQGPPLVDGLYHPGHHSDFSFRNAISEGVRQHHWLFGNMPPAAGVSSEDAEKIICYVREAQRANGLFEGDDYSTVC